MNNKVSDGLTTKFVAGAAILAGDVVVYGGRCGIAVNDVVNTATGILALTGVYNVTKKAAITPAPGVAMFWDTTPGEATATRADGVFLGHVFGSAAPGSGDATLPVNIGGAGDIGP